MSSPTVPRLHRPEVREFRRRCEDASAPAVLTGAFDHWPARGWTVDRIAARLGDAAVTPVVLTEGRFEVDLREGVRVAAMPAREYLDRVRRPGSPGHYLRLQLDPPYDDLAREAPTPRYCTRVVGLKKNLWVGAAGTASDLHYDMTHNLVAQVEGRRRVTLFAPDESPRLYPHPARSLNGHHSQVRLDRPDHERFPAFRGARRVEVALDAGEMLFIPRGWWHHFESVSLSIAVNVFWVTPRHLPALAAAKLAWAAASIRT